MAGSDYDTARQIRWQSSLTALRSKLLEDSSPEPARVRPKSIVC
jgi:hypothetical protein